MAYANRLAITCVFLGLIPISLSELCSDDIYPGGELAILRSSERHLLQSLRDVNDAVCGDIEHYCGDSDVFLDQAYTAGQSSNCSQDTGSTPYA